LKRNKNFFLRGNYFGDCVFDSLNAATDQVEKGLSEMAANGKALQRLIHWPWISTGLKD
jgi:hypothetical protein